MSVQQISADKVVTNNFYITDEKTMQQFEKNAIRRLVRKLDWRIIPLMSLIELASAFNRFGIGKYLRFQSF